jgi:hypothetical protein
VCVSTVYRTFASVDRRLEEIDTFAVNVHSTERRPSVRKLYFDSEILQGLENNSSTSTGAFAHEVVVDRRQVWNVVRNNSFTLSLSDIKYSSKINGRN